MDPRRVIVAVSVTLLACEGGSDSIPTRSLVVTDSAGVEIVTNPGEPPPAPLVLRETLRLGALDGPPHQQFADIRKVAVNARGDVFVADRGTATVRVFNPEGAFLAELGGRGEGPGEVRSLDDIFVSGDTVGLVDWQRRGKVALHRVDGTLLAEWTVTQPDRVRIQPLHPTPHGWLTQVDHPDRFQRPSPGESYTLYSEIHLTEFGSIEVGAPVYSVPVFTLYGVEGQEGAADWPLFWPRTYRGFDEQGRLFVTNSQAYRVDIHDRAGLRRSVRRTHSPRPIGEQDVAELLDAALAVVDTMSRIPEEVRPRERRQLEERMERQASLPLPELMTPLSGLLVSPDGSFWVRVADPSTLVRREADGIYSMGDEFAVHETRWHLFDTEGHLLGEATLPSRFRADAVNGLQVVGVWADDLDVEHVVRYEVQPNRPEV